VTACESVLRIEVYFEPRKKFATQITLGSGICLVSHMPQCVKQLDMQTPIGLYNGTRPPMSIHHAHTTIASLPFLPSVSHGRFTLSRRRSMSLRSPDESQAASKLCAGPSMLLAPNKLYPTTHLGLPSASLANAWLLFFFPILLRVQGSLTCNQRQHLPDQNLLDDSLLDDHVQIMGIGVSAVSK
jgi:hypothetical protein